MGQKDYKKLSIEEFSKAAEVYETDRAGVYKMCKKDYPDVLAELEKEPFEELLDCGCGTAPMLTLLKERFPEKHYTGIDLTPKMIEAARAKNMPGVDLVVGDCENLPFPENSFDAVICCQSFHHYPNVQNFFNSVYRVLRPGGRLILRDMTSDSPALIWVMNNIEVPAANLTGHGDVHVYNRDEVEKLCNRAGLVMESFECRGIFRLHCVARKPADGSAKANYSRISQSYKSSQNIYDSVLTGSKWWSKLYINLFWGGVDDCQIAEKVMGFIPSDFSGKLLDVPCGTAVFTHKKYGELPDAEITCLDYSEDMLNKARSRLGESVKFVQGDVGNMPFRSGEFDIVLSMNGFHAFPDKKASFRETHRVLRRGGKFMGCCYIKGRSKVTDVLVSGVLARKGWFTPPFDTAGTLRRRLEKAFDIEEFQTEGSMVIFSAIKK